MPLQPPPPPGRIPVFALLLSLGLAPLLPAQGEAAESPKEEPAWKRLAGPDVFTEESYDREGMRAAARDAFPVLDHPEMVLAAAGSKEIDDAEPVIGVVIEGEARAYPISVMGGVELVNDTCGAVPFAVSW